jgi:hypothetical protein
MAECTRSCESGAPASAASVRSRNLGPQPYIRFAIKDPIPRTGRLKFDTANQKPVQP